MQGRLASRLNAKENGISDALGAPLAYRPKGQNHLLPQPLKCLYGRCAGLGVGKARVAELIVELVDFAA